MTENQELIDVIEKINMEYIQLVNSREYVCGRRLIQFCDDFKSRDFFGLCKRLSAYLSKGKYERINNKIKMNSDIKSLKTNKKLVDLDMTDKKVAIYCCVTGGYDVIKKPLYKNRLVDYFLVTDEEGTFDGWDKIKMPNNIIEKKLDNVSLNRFVKMHPYEIFHDYDYAIYVDGKVRIISDLIELLSYTNCYYGIAMHNHTYRNDIYEEEKACIAYKKGNLGALRRQIERYEEERFPHDFGMREASVIAFDLNNSNGKRIMDKWWNEFVNSNSKRDQIALPYVIWKDGRTIEDIGTFGNSVEINPKFRINGKHI